MKKETKEIEEETKNDGLTEEETGFFIYLSMFLIVVSVILVAFCFNPRLVSEDKAILAGGAVLFGLLSVHAHILVLTVTLRQKVEEK